LERSWLAPFGHVFGMIKVDAGQAGLSELGVDAAQAPLATDPRPWRECVRPAA
jgi:hypothetical protein